MRQETKTIEQIFYIQVSKLTTKSLHKVNIQQPHKTIDIQQHLNNEAGKVLEVQKQSVLSECGLRCL